MPVVVVHLPQTLAVIRLCTSDSAFRGLVLSSTFLFIAWIYHLLPFRFAIGEQSSTAIPYCFCHLPPACTTHGLPVLAKLQHDLMYMAGNRSELPLLPGF